MNRNGVVRLSCPKNSYRGTAVIIGPRHLLTCAHVVAGIRPDATFWIDKTYPGTILHVDKATDLAIVELNERLNRAPVPWRLSGRTRDTVTAAGFPAGWKYNSPKEIETTITSASPSFTELSIAEHLDEGMSGGGLFQAQGTSICLIGILQARRELLTSSTVIGAATVKAFCQRHGIAFPEPELDSPPPTELAGYDERKYVDWLHGITRHIDFRGLKAGQKEVREYPMERLYIPLMTTQSRGSVLLEDAVATQSRLVIQGDAGSGKSTFLRRLAWQYSRKRRAKATEYFPLLITISRLDTFIHARAGQQGFPVDPASPRWLPAFLANESAEKKWDLDFDYFDTRLSRPGTLVLLDGLDEVVNVPRRELVARLFEAALAAYGHCRWVVSTRPRAYEGKSTLSGFEVCSILDLEAPQIQAFIAEWSLCLKEGDAAAAETHSADLQAALAKSPPAIARMARNPLMLSALAVVHYNERRLPDQRAELYECILQWLAKSRMEKAGRPRPETILNYLGFLAFTMQDVKGQYRIRIGKGQAAEWLAQEFAALENASEFLDSEELDSGIIAADGNDLKFYHRSYQEFLAARYLAERRAALRWQDARPRLLRQEWRESFILLAGVLYNKGEDVLHEFFENLLAFGVGEKSLADRARVVGLAGSMLNDLRVVRYELNREAAQPYAELRQDVLRIFEPDGAPDINIRERAEIANALGQAGDPRLCLPKDERYWVRAGDLEFGRYPVTVFEYAAFVDAGGPEPGQWTEQLERPNWPVVYVSWDWARRYCEWVGGARLASAEEWEAAARGAELRKYPWGNEPEPDEERANFGMNVGRVTSVGLFPKGETPDGLSDMVGNVWEWTSSEYDSGWRVVRGGSYIDYGWSLRGSDRVRFEPGVKSGSLGFRLVRG